MLAEAWRIAVSALQQKGFLGLIFFFSFFHFDGFGACIFPQIFLFYVVKQSTRLTDGRKGDVLPFLSAFVFSTMLCMSDRWVSSGCILVVEDKNDLHVK